MRDEIYDFLYVHDFDGWVLNGFKALFVLDSRCLKEFVMRFHTGESLLTATPSWTGQQRAALGQRLLRELAQCLIRDRQTNPEFETSGTTDRVAVDRMQKALELDGYVYREGLLWVPEEGVVQEAEEQGVLEGLMASTGLPDSATIRHHLELSALHYQEERWDDSISNSRKVLEGVLEQAARLHSLKASETPLPEATASKQVLVRDYLETAGLLEKKEKCAVAEVYGLLSNTGAHPYVAHRDQARLMRHLALTFTQFVLLRLEGSLR
ncbi:MAG: hypothetical protein ACOY3Y_03270 [Acidobacteriota bacterium]